MVTQRLSIPSGEPVINDFPSNSRTALAYVVSRMENLQYIDQKTIIHELNRIGRFTADDNKMSEGKNFITKVGLRLQKLRWFDVMNFCERVYEKYLNCVSDNFGDIVISLDEVREYFASEINQILLEDNIAFIFENGLFIRRGKAQTQKLIQKASTVLSDPKLEFAKKHYNKALSYFNLRPESDAQNCVKEALCALEASIEILTDKKASQDFDKAINQLKGNNDRHIPAPITESIIKLHGYRGSGQGVAHAAITGNRVVQHDAELVLSLVGAYITYIYSIFPPIDDIPF